LAICALAIPEDMKPLAVKVKAGSSGTSRHRISSYIGTAAEIIATIKLTRYPENGCGAKLSETP